MSFSEYLEEGVLKHVFKVTSFTVPTNLYIALSTADPGEDGSTIAEPSGGAYARVNFNTWQGDGQQSGSYQVSNNGAITFTTASGANWGTISHFAIFDADTAGNMLVSGALTTSRAVNDGDTASFPSGALKIRLN